MNYRISHPTKKLTGTITLTASKSESNRALIIQALCSEKFEINNLATAQDTITMHKVLTSLPASEPLSITHNVGPAGTVMSANFLLEGQEFVALNGGPHFTFAEGISLFVSCETQEEVDDLWEKLSAGGEKGSGGPGKPDTFAVSARQPVYRWLLVYRSRVQTR